MTDSVATQFLTLKRKLFNRFYDNLNDEQREAVFTVNGPLLVLAGAGTGKTTVLVNRIAHIIRYGNAFESSLVPSDINEQKLLELEGALTLSKEEISLVLSEFISEPCPPWSILCITFTNKAASEMKERLSLTLGDEYAEQIWAGTFHSICVRLLRKYGENIGYPSNFTIYDSDDSKRMILGCMKDLNIDDKSLPVKSVQNQISSCKNKLQTPDELSVEAGSNYRLSQIASVYHLYQKKLYEASALDFDDIIMQTVRLLNEVDEARSYCQNRFKHVCVDEFQDTNYAQLKLVELLSGRYRNLMVVGDDDQSIYKFRGATVENILKFDKIFSDAKIIRLEQNYRSTANILNAANEVIANNSRRHQKSLRTTRDDGEKLILRRCENQNEESRYIINRITDMVVRDKRKYSDFAVLYRMNAQSQNLEQFFVRSGIPHKVIGGQRFFERKEIKDILSYLAVINNPADNLRLKRIINEPKRKIGEKTVSDIEYLAGVHGVSMFEVMSEADRYPQIVRSASNLKAFVTIINELTEIANTENISSLFEKTIEITGYKSMLIAAGEAEADRLNNIQELISTAVSFEKEREDEATLQAYLEDVALLSDIDSYDDDGNAVVLMTIHSAKGLEFPVVFLPGLEEGIFPGMQASGFPEEIEEERRLAYVALTRAKDKIYCLHTRERLMFGRTQFNPVSRFVKEIPDTYIISEQCDQTEHRVQYSSAEKKRPEFSREFYSDPTAKNTVKRVVERFNIGDRVSHVAFGEGTILSAREMGADVLYEIMFDDVGIKKLMATYAKLKRA